MADFPDLSSVVNRQQQGPFYPPVGGQGMPPQQQTMPPVNYPPVGGYGPTANAPPAPIPPPQPTGPSTNWMAVGGRAVAGLALVAAVVATGYVLNKGEMSANDDDDEDDDMDDDEDDADDGDVDEAKEILRQAPRPSSAFAPNPSRRGRR